jgi:hypothetical protein
MIIIIIVVVVVVGGGGVVNVGRSSPMLLVKFFIGICWFRLFAHHLL